MSRYVDVPNALLVMPAMLGMFGIVAITFDRCMTNTRLTELQECVAYRAAAEKALERCEGRRNNE